MVVVRVAITEQVLNYPPDVRCGGGGNVCVRRVWGVVGVHLGEDRVPFHMWSGVRNGPVLPGAPCA